MRTWPQPWRSAGFGAVITATLCLAGSVGLFLAGMGPPGRPFAFMVSGLLFLVAATLYFGVGWLGFRLARTGRIPTGPVDPARTAALRRALPWALLSCVPLFAGLAWLAFALNQFPGSKGPILGSVGLIFALAVSSVVYLPFLRVVMQGRRMLGMSATRFTVLNAAFFVIAAAALAITQLTQPG